VRNPKRNLPLSLALGTSVVLGLYILANFVYLLALPLHGDPHGTTIAARGIQYASEDRVATAALQMIFARGGAWLMAGAILISTFGCANGLTLAGARVYYAMSRDGLFFKSAAKLHPRWHTPVAALIVQAVWSCVLCISGSYGQLLDYIICTELIFYILTILCLFVLRAKRPQAERPYRAIGYPVLPAIYILMAAWICIVLLRYKPQYTWPGLVIVLLGVPVFFVWSRSAIREPSPQAESAPE
jgi:APA family basic amino acid/polyamine antiporter